MRGGTIAVAVAASVMGTGLLGAGQAVFRARVDLVRLQVLVTDDRRPVTGLSAQDFEVRDNGVRQEVEAVYGESRPLDVLLVMDRSESLRGEPMERLRAAAHRTVDALRAEDRCGLLTFSHRLALVDDLSTDRTPIRGALDRLEADGLTSITDALYGALSLPFAPDRRSLILLFSDGLDNRSWTTVEEVTNRAQQSESIIAAVAYKPPAGVARLPNQPSQPDLPFLMSLAGETGGEVIEVERPDQFASAFAALLERARARYLVTYYPKGVAASGWHEVKVTLRGRRGAVTARRGYLAGK